MAAIERYLDLVKEQDRTREAIRLLEESTTDPKQFQDLTRNFQTFKDLVEELDSDQSDRRLPSVPEHSATITKLNKTSLYIDQ